MYSCSSKGEKELLAPDEPFTTPVVLPSETYQAHAAKREKRLEEERLIRKGAGLAPKSNAWADKLHIQRVGRSRRKREQISLKDRKPLEERGQPWPGGNSPHPGGKRKTIRRRKGEKKTWLLNKKNLFDLQ